MTGVNMKFKNERVLLIGGTSGIGLAAAKAFASAGAEVTVASSSNEKIERALTEIGNQSSGHQINIRDDADVERAINMLGEFHHIVISTAPSPMPIGRTDSFSIEEAYRAMDTKFWGAYRIGRLAKIIPGGSLTFVSGILSARPTKSSALLSAINAALDGLVRGLALERAPVRVNSVSPGILANAAILTKLTETQRLEAGARLPVQKIGTPEQVAEAIMFLAANTYVTGSTVVIDGGGSLV